MSRTEDNTVYLKQAFETFKKFILPLAAKTEKTELFDNFEQNYRDFSDLLEIYCLNPNEFIVNDESKLFESMEINDHDDQNICAVKTFILLFFFGLSNTEKNSKQHLQYSSKFRLFLNTFIEDEILPQVFECRERIFEVSTERQVEKIETGIETLEKHAQLLLHLYIRLSTAMADSKCSLGIGLLEESSSPPNCLLIAISLYFCEKKEKFLKENSGKLWNVSRTEFLILEDLITFSNIRLYAQFFEDSEKNVRKCLFESLYYLAELTEGDDDMLIIISDFLSEVLIGEQCDDLLFPLMIEDLKLVNNLDDSKLITNELISDMATDDVNYKRNVGKPAYIIKIKLLRFLVSLEESLSKSESYLDSLVPLQNRFRDFIINLLNKEIQSASGSLLSHQAIGTGIVMISVNGDLSEESLQTLPEEDVNYINQILSLFQQLLLSSNSTTRSTTFSCLEAFLENTNYHSDELVESIIKNHEFINNVKGLYELLGGVAQSVSKSVGRGNIDNKVVESFKLLIRKAFDNCTSDNLEYLKMSIGKDEEPETHNMYIEKFFRMTQHTYPLAKDLLEPILKFIQKKMLDLEERNETLLPPFALTLKEICKSTERNTLLKTFEKLNYYEFIVHFIEKYFEFDSDLSFEMAPVFELIGHLSDLRIFHSHFSFYRNKLSGEKQDFLNDYLLPFIAKAIAPIPRRITNNYQKADAYYYINKLGDLFWTIQRIVINDILLYGEKKSYPILEAPIRLILGNLLSHISLFEDRLESNTLDEKNYTLFGAILVLLGDNLDNVIELLHFPYLYETNPSLKRSKDQYLVFKFVELMEYALDKDMPIVDRQIDWVEEVKLELIPECRNLPLVSLLKRVVNKILIKLHKTEDGDDDDNDDNDMWEDEEE